jgi:hypothetical protein
LRKNGNPLLTSRVVSAVERGDDHDDEEFKFDSTARTPNRRKAHCL